jgi:hypothetical protein
MMWCATHFRRELSLSWGLMMNGGQPLFDTNAMALCHIQWLYLAVQGCKTYLNLNLNRVKLHCELSLWMPLHIQTLVLLTLL